jgi:hypothetical protein
MGRKRKLRMTVRVVPQGTLRPNPRNEFAKETPEARLQGILTALARGLANLDEDGRTSSGSPPGK